MKTIAERVLDVLRASPEPMTGDEIFVAGQFNNKRQVYAALWAMSKGDDCILYSSQREGGEVASNGVLLTPYEYAIIPRPSNQP